MNGRPSTVKQRRTPRGPALAGSVRTCIGCGAPDVRQATLRVCLDENGAPTLAHRGRGARLHPRARCVSGAARRGLSRSFRREVRSTPSSLATMLVDDARSRATRAIAGARRAGSLTTDEAEIGDDGLVVVAVDAGETTQHPVIAGAIAGGRAVALLSRRELGALVQRDQAPVVVIHHERFASVVRDACATIDALRITVSEVG